MLAALAFLLLAFPGERGAGLPTGLPLEKGFWQLTIQHRFFNSVTDPGWTSDPLQALAFTNSHIGVDRGIADNLSVGAAVNVSDRLVALHSAWRPLSRLAVYPELSVRAVDPGLDGIWLNVAAGLPVTIRGRLHVFPFVRATGGKTGQLGSFGHTFKYAFGDYRLGLEFEDAIFVSDSAGARFRAGLDSLPWTLSFEREAGWHNFVFTVGTACHSLPPQSLQQDVLDVTRGRLRVGFNILRKI